MTELAAIIGWPVARSLSPAIHNAAFDALGMDWTYVPIGVRPGALDDGIGVLRSLGVRGANVTIPHKQHVVAHTTSLDDEARAIGAVNTLVLSDGELAGSNTDAAGFLAALADEGFDPAGRTAAVLGAGGAARAVVHALVRAGALVSVTARRSEQAAALAAGFPGTATAPWGAEIACDLVVQATPGRGDLPLDGVRFAPDVLAFDLVYGVEPTPFCAAAARAGGRAVDGLGMLVHQAALSFQTWTGRPPPVEAMHAGARAALGRRPPGG